LERPESLDFKDVCEFEQAQPDGRKAALIDASYRMTDGAFLYVRVSGVKGVTYFYASNKPTATDDPVAFEIQLPEGPK
jgi:hypothetical protein